MNYAASPSPWDMISPSPEPVRASGASSRTPNSHNTTKSHRLYFQSQRKTELEEVCICTH